MSAGVEGDMESGLDVEKLKLLKVVFSEDTSDLVMKRVVAPGIKVKDVKVNFCQDKRVKNEFSDAVFGLVILCSTGLTNEMRLPEKNIFVGMKSRLEQAVGSDELGNFRQAVSICLYESIVHSVNCKVARMKSDDKDVLLEENTPVRDAMEILQLQAKSIERPGKFHGKLGIIHFFRVIPLTFLRFKSIRTEKKEN